MSTGRPATGRPDEVMGQDAILIDFLIWLAKKNVVEHYTLPRSGRWIFGKGMHEATDLISEYWKSYQ